MRILITNDDGFDAPGLKLLRDIALELGEVWTVAPKGDRSGSGRSITLRTPIDVLQHGQRSFEIDGTPAECVVIALYKLMHDSPPDLILSGINSGSNIGADVTCSGTVGAALEGALLNIPSIALSQRRTGKREHMKIDWTVSQTFAPGIIKSLLLQGWPSDVVMNVNFPDTPTVRGIKVISQGRHNNTNDLGHNVDVHGRMSCIILGTRPAAGDGSVDAVANGYIAITPIKSDMTDYALLGSSFPDQLLSKLEHDFGTEGIRHKISDNVTASNESVVEIYRSDDFSNEKA